MSETTIAHNELVDIQGPNIRLRQLTEDDVQTIMDIKTRDPEDYADAIAWTSAEEAKVSVNQDPAETGELHLAIEVEDQIAGGVSLKENDGVAAVSYWVATPHRRKGITSAALTMAINYAKQNWGIEFFIGIVRAKNGASRKTLEKVGFQNAGFMPEYPDILIYGLDFRDETLPDVLSQDLSGGN